MINYNTSNPIVNNLNSDKNVNLALFADIHVFFTSFWGCIYYPGLFRLLQCANLPRPYLYFIKIPKVYTTLSRNLEWFSPQMEWDSWLNTWKLATCKIPRIIFTAFFTSYEEKFPLLFFSKQCIFEDLNCNYHFTIDVIYLEHVQISRPTVYMHWKSNIWNVNGQPPNHLKLASCM